MMTQSMRVLRAALFPPFASFKRPYALLTIVDRVIGLRIR